MSVTTALCTACFECLSSESTIMSCLCWNRLNEWRILVRWSIDPLSTVILPTQCAFSATLIVFVSSQFWFSSWYFRLAGLLHIAVSFQFGFGFWVLRVFWQSTKFWVCWGFTLSLGFGCNFWFFVLLPWIHWLWEAVVWNQFKRRSFGWNWWTWFLLGRVGCWW